MKTRLIVLNKNHHQANTNVFKYEIPGGIIFNPDSGIMLKDFNMTNHIPNISSNLANNQFRIKTKNKNGADKTLDIQLVDGNYSISDIEENINQVFDKNNIDRQKVKFVFSDVYDRVIILTKSNTEVHFTNQKFKTLLGFSLDTIPENSLSSAGNPCLLKNVKYIKIKCNVTEEETLSVINQTEYVNNVSIFHPLKQLQKFTDIQLSLYDQNDVPIKDFGSHISISLLISIG